MAANEVSGNPAKADGEQKSTKQVYRREAKTIFLIIFFILIFRSSFFEPFKIPSGSMIPTLLVGDFILVNKMSYGFKIPFSDWLGDPIYLSKPEMPKRGDIIVFKYPKDTSLNYIKRLVGLPGDHIQVIDNILYVNGQAAVRNEINAAEAKKLKAYLFEQNNGMSEDEIAIFETQTGERKHLIQHMTFPRHYNMANTIEWVIPEGNFFVMGDNRDNSQDSRFWEYVPFGYIKGKAFLVWLNLNLPIFQTEGATYPFMFNLDRIGKLVY